LPATAGRSCCARTPVASSSPPRSPPSWPSGVGQAFIENGSPQQNPYVERFNRMMRDELLNGEEFESLLEARVVIAGWLD
jgi:hypothetical protein